MLNKFAGNLKKNVLILILLFISSMAMSLKNDDKQPLQIEATKATANLMAKTSVFIGNVVITKGSLVIHANKGVANEDKDGNRVLILNGSPVTFSQMQDDGLKIEGQADKFEYNSKASLAILSGRALIKRGKSQIVGDMLTYNTQTQVYSATSNFDSGVKKSSNGRITLILDQVPNNDNKPSKK